MTKIVSLGKINNKYFIILALFILLKFFINLIYHFSDKLKENKLLEVLLYHFGIFLSIIPEFIRKKISKGEKKYSKPELVNENEKKLVEYLYHNPYNEKLTLGNILIIFIFCILLILLEFCYLYEDYLDYDNSIENYYFIENLIWFFLPKIVFKFHYYSHQIFSIIIIIIIWLINTIIVIIINKKFNYKKLFIDIIICIMETISYGNIKGLIKYKYFSPFKIGYIIGLINTFLVIIIFFIVSHLPCNFEPLCEGKPHLDSIYSLKHFDVSEILLISAYSLLIGFQFLLINLILYDFTFYHVLIPFHIKYVIYEIFYPSKRINSILTFICFFIEIFLILVFLEIIELNFCGLIL